MKDVTRSWGAVWRSLFVTWLCMVPVAAGQSEPPAVPQPASDGAKVLTVAIMPFHNEAADEFKYLQAQIAISAGVAIQQSDRAVIVNRDYVATIVDEKRMAETGVTAQPKQPVRGQMIAADIIAFGRYDVYDGQLTITCELIPADNFVASYEALYWRKKVPLQIKRIEVIGPVQNTRNILTDFNRKLNDAIPKMGTSVLPASAPPANPTVAVFDFISDPHRQNLLGLAASVTDALSLKLSSDLHAKLVERQRLDAVIAEHHLSTAGLSDRGWALTVGRLLGADYILIGSLRDSSGALLIDTQLLDVSTGLTVVAASSSSAKHDPVGIAAALAKEISDSLSQGLAATQHLKQRRLSDGVEAVPLIQMACNIWEKRQGTPDARKQRVLNLMWAALDMAPDNARVNSNVGYLYEEFKQYDRAEHHYKRAIALAPENGSYQCELGILYWRDLKRYDDAEHVLQQAMEQLSPRDLYYRKLGLNLSWTREKKGDIDGAIEAVRNGLRSPGWYWRDEIFEQLGKLLEIKMDLPGAAAAYEKAVRLRPQYASKERFLAARRLLLATGQRDKAMQILHIQIEVGRYPSVDDKLELAEYYTDKAPPLAAELCYNFFLYDEYQPYRARVAQLLESHHIPLERPIFTGSVFDLDQCRDLGIRVVIQPYEGFRYMQWMPYLKAQMEDMIGVEVVIGEGQRKFSDAMYDRTRNEISRADPTFFSLNGLRKEHGATGVAGLTSTPLEDGWVTHRWRQRLSITSTHGLNDAKPPTFNDAGLYSIVYPQIAKSFTFGQEVQSMTTYDPLCLCNTCVNEDFTMRQLERVPVYCPACRYDFRKRYSEYPLGPESRPPLEVGPRLPAILDRQSLRPVLLMALGFKPGDSHAAEAAHAIEMATGLPVEVIEVPTLPPLAVKVDNGFHLLTQKGLIEYGVDAANTQGSPAAVCLWVNSDLEFEWPRFLPWYMRLPGQHDAPKNLKCPVIVSGPCVSNRFTQCELLRRLVHVETVTDPAQPDKPFEVPMYAKYFVAGLATAAIPDHQCWTYGCPTTIWENIGDAARCSHWLCDDCRAAMKKYYAK